MLEDKETELLLLLGGEPATSAGGPIVSSQELQASMNIPEIVVSAPGINITDMRQSSTSSSSPCSLFNHLHDFDDSIILKLDYSRFDLFSSSLVGSELTSQTTSFESTALSPRPSLPTVEHTSSTASLTSGRMQDSVTVVPTTTVVADATGSAATDAKLLNPSLLTSPSLDEHGSADESNDGDDSDDDDTTSRTAREPILHVTDDEWLGTVDFYPTQYSVPPPSPKKEIIFVHACVTVEYIRV